MKEKIVIKEKKISGLTHPMLYLSGYLKEQSKLDVYADGILIDSHLRIIDEDFFILTALLLTSYHIIEVKCAKEVIVHLKNSFFSRFCERIHGIIYVIWRKICLFFRVFLWGMKKIWQDYHFLVPPKMWKVYYQGFMERIRQNNSSYALNPLVQKEYLKWLSFHEKKTNYTPMPYEPLISLLIPVYNISSQFLSLCIDSILHQTYSHFEICLVDDASSNLETIETLKKYEQLDPRVRVKYRKENGHISKATNDALKMAKGEYVGLVDNDDVLREDALAKVVEALNENQYDLIYSDEDKLDLHGKRCYPNLKPDYSPDFLLSSNYICHFTVLRKSIVEKVGGFRVGFEGAQDYDLFLRVTEVTKKIHHIPEILYHWRMVNGSTSMEISNKSYALEKGKKALEEALKRRKIKGSVHIHPKVPYYYIEYQIKTPKVCILIPIRDHASTTEKCLKSIYEKTTYSNFEVDIINNGSEKEETFELLKQYQKMHSNFKVIDANMEFNYSKINNIGVSKTNSEYLLLLNNDIEVITPNWIEILLGYASQKHVGAVGAKLLYPDNTVQHGGIIIGLGGVAGHAYTGLYKDSRVFGGRLSVPCDVGGVTAACLMISRKKYESVNGLEEKLKVAFNDVDFNLKLQEKGYYNVFVPQVELYHDESKSRGTDTKGEKYKRFISEVEFMQKKWNEKLFTDPFYNKNYSLKYSYMLDKEEKEKKAK